MLGQNHYESPVPEEKKTNLQELIAEKSHLKEEQQKVARTAVNVILKEMRLEKRLGEKIDDFTIEINPDNTANVTLRFDTNLEDSEWQAVNNLLHEGEIDNEARERGVHFQME